MIPHLFKLIWNKKKQNFLLMLEILVSFMVIFAVSTLVVYSYKNYMKPSGFNYKNVRTINYGFPAGIESNDSVSMVVDALRKNILAVPGVEEVSFASNNVPFAMTRMNSMADYKGKSAMTDIYRGEISYKQLLQLELLEGKWFSRSDIGQKHGVINQTFKAKMFGNESPVGKVVNIGDEKIKVLGVIADFKSSGDYQVVEPGIYRPLDTGDYRWENSILVRVSPEANTATEAKLFSIMSNVSKGTSVEIEHLDKKRASKNKMTLIPIIILLIVATFLIINVALGIFGVLWYNINKRRGEIGLRRAIGASGNSISGQLILEALVLSTIALLTGSFFAVQFPLLNVFDLPSGVYFIALFSSIIFIYLLVMICSIYPGRQASAIYPAVALHEE